jgi:hypothetical protein
MISGKAFADVCKWVLDPRYPDRATFHPSLASNNDWVFLNGDCFDRLIKLLQESRVFRPFVVKTAPKRFVFVIHNTDSSFDEARLNQLLPHAVHIYAINTVVSHPALTTIPLGFVDRQLPLLSTFVRPDVPRDIEIYANFTLSTNPEKRRDCLQSFPHATVRENLSVPEYYSDLCRSKFVLCPVGTGIDTHRVYESLLFGAIPVVLRGTLPTLYSSLPLCVLDTWADPLYVPEPKQFHTGVLHYLSLRTKT